MTAPRFDLYTLVHKGQRRMLSEIVGLAGQIGVTEAGVRQALVARVEEFFGTLDEHGEFEDKYVGPLHAEADPEVATRLQSDHAEIDRRMKEIRSLMAVAVADPSAVLDLKLYRSLAMLASAYFAHTDREESSMPSLWARFDDARLAEVQSAIVAAHQPETRLYNLKAMLPAASSQERVGFLRGLKRGMPPPVFGEIRLQIGTLLDAREWSAIDA